MPGRLGSRLETRLWQPQEHQIIRHKNIFYNLKCFFHISLNFHIVSYFNNYKNHFCYKMHTKYVNITSTCWEMLKGFVTKMKKNKLNTNSSVQLYLGPEYGCSCSWLWTSVYVEVRTTQRCLFEALLHLKLQQRV